MKTMLLAAIAAATLAGGTAFAGEGNGPDFPAYNAAVAMAANQAITATVPTLTTGSAEVYPSFAGRQVQVQSNVAVADTGSAAYPDFAGLTAQTPEAADQIAQSGQDGSQG